MWKECQKKIIAKKVFKNTPESKTSVGRSKKRWFDDVENCLKKMDVRDWR